MTESHDLPPTADRLSEILGPQSRLWIRIALLAWGGLAIAVTVKTIIDPSTHTVFPNYAEASRDWWAHHPVYHGAEYLYSPTFAIAFSPFAALGDRLGGVVWNIFNLAVLLVALALFAREILPAEWTPRARALFIGLSLAGTLRGVWAAQSNGLLISCAMLAAVAIVHRRWSIAAALLTCSLYVKLWPVALILILIARYPKPLFARLAFWIGALGLVPFLTGPPSWVAGQYRSWFNVLLGPAQNRLPGVRDAKTILGQLTPGTELAFYPMLQLGTVGLLFLWCVWRQRTVASERRLLPDLIAAWVVWQLLFGPGSERTTYGILGPPASWAVIASFAAGRHRSLALTTWLVLLLFGSSGSLERVLLGVLPYAPAILPTGVLVFAAWLALRSREEYQGRA